MVLLFIEFGMGICISYDFLLHFNLESDNTHRWGKDHCAV